MLEDAEARTLYVKCLPFEDPTTERVQTLAVQVNGRSAGEIVLDAGWGEYGLALPEGLLRAGVNHIQFAYGYHLSPAELGIDDDTRTLAIGFERIALIETETFDSEKPMLDLRREALIAHQAGRLYVPFRFAGDAAGLAFSARSHEGDGEQRLRLSYASVAGGEPVELLVRRSAEVSGDALFSGEIPVRGAPGEIGCLMLDLDPGPGGALEISAPSLLGGPSEPTAESGSAAEPSSLPDVVVLILDAARPDHFGCYGYERDTTPNIDRLARESLIFENAFAESAYTRASAPTMFTGLAFADHGVSKKEQRLDENATTLAEYLKQAGYRTVCYSANPNNSAEAGLAQGCDEFAAFWREQDLLVSVDPFRVTDRALELLRRHDDAPLFLMLHYVPPHEPYHPTEDFDVFGEPAAASGIDGTRRTLVAINSGELQLDGEGRARLISLYDGNLLKGDAAVGQVLEALMQRERWDETLVLIVADHGEAFGEHGRMGHSSTVYDEMLRVPFILRLPGGRRPDSVDTVALASLADIVPTILGTIGVKPAAGVGGVDLLASRSREGRGIVANSGDGAVAFRTLDWKVIVDPKTGRPEVFHVASDPGESRNLIAEQLDRFFCVNRLLQQTLTGDSRVTAAAADELSPEDLEALRSLGYVD